MALQLLYGVSCLRIAQTRPIVGAASLLSHSKWTTELPLRRSFSSAFRSQTEADKPGISLSKRFRTYFQAGDPTSPETQANKPPKTYFQKGNSETVTIPRADTAIKTYFQDGDSEIQKTKGLKTYFQARDPEHVPTNTPKTYFRDALGTPSQPENLTPLQSTQPKVYIHSQDGSGSSELPPPSRFLLVRVLFCLPVMGSIMFLCCYLCYLWNMEPRMESTIRDHFFDSAENLKAGRTYTLLTSTFMHCQPSHLVINMLALWGFRSFIPMYGFIRFFSLWIGAGISGSLFSQYFSQNYRDAYSSNVSVGASATLCGFLVAVTAVKPLAMVNFRLPGIPAHPAFVPVLTLAMLSLLFLEYDLIPGVDHAGHLGGMAFGLVFGVLAMRRGKLKGLKGLKGFR